MTAAGVTPLDHTILSGTFPHHLKAPLVLGNEGAGVVRRKAERFSRRFTRDVLRHLWRF